MRKQVLIFSLIIGSVFSGYCQKELSVVDIEVKVNMPIVKKEGRIPEKKEVLVNAYSIIYEVPDRYNRGKFMQFTKHIETYKKKKIRELVFETGLLEGGRSYKINLRSTQDIINTYKSTTKAEQIKFVYARRPGFYDYEADNFNEKDIISRIRQKKTKPLKLSEFFLSKVPDEEFLNYLNNNKINKNSIAELLDLKRFADKRIEELRKADLERQKRQSLIGKWQRKNSTLESRIKRWIPNKGSVNIDVDYYEKDGLKIRLLGARFKWQNEFSKGNGTENKFDNLLKIEYPKESPFEGEVYLRLLDNLPGGIHLFEVFKSNTKKELPFKRLRLDFAGGGFVNATVERVIVYGVNGSVNDILSNDISSRDQFSHQKDMLIKSGDKIEVPKGSQTFEVSLDNEKFKNYYLEGKAPTAEKEYHAYYKRKRKEKEERIQATIDSYDLSREKSMESNGFFLETRDFEANREDEDIDIALSLIYRGRFDVMKSYSWIDDLVIGAIANQFMRKRAVKCGVSHIPKSDIVPIMDEVCVEETVTRNGYGVVVNRSCSDWEDRPSGLYTSKKLFLAHAKVKSKIDKKAFGTALKLLTNRGGAMATEKIVSDILNDLNKMLRLNGCGSEALDRFEENLIRFINDERPLKLK